jgi:acyl phosphate:glycerol-3-phosphate acyltransferase
VVIGSLGARPATLADAFVAAVALVAGYLVGSIPLATLIGRAAGVGAVANGEAIRGPGDIWGLAGPGWGLLALSGELAKGVLPATLAAVTWSWLAGGAAGLGAVLGASWPLLGRMHGGRGLAVFAGVAFALAPGAATLAGLLGLGVLGVTVAAGRRSGQAALSAGLASYPVLLLAAGAEPAQLAAVGLLFLVIGWRTVTVRRRGTGLLG